MLGIIDLRTRGNILSARDRCWVLHDVWTFLASPDKRRLPHQLDPILHCSVRTKAAAAAADAKKKGPGAGHHVQDPSTHLLPFSEQQLNEVRGHHQLPCALRAR